MFSKRNEVVNEPTDVPRTPAELPMKDPRRVIEFRILFNRNRALGTASLRVLPSRKPHAPPSASPTNEIPKVVSHWLNGIVQVVFRS